MGNTVDISNYGITTISTNVIFLLDTSSSMDEERIAQLNHAMRETLNALKEKGEKVEEDVFVRVIRFSTHAEWIMGDEEAGVLIDDAIKQWKDLAPGGLTNTAEAINECLKALQMKYFNYRSKKPVVVLVTDGESIDPTETRLAVDKLKTALSGNTGKEKVIRIAIGIGDYNPDELNYFASRGTICNEYGTFENVPLVLSASNSNEIADLVTRMVASDNYAPFESPYQIGGDQAEFDDDEPIVIDFASTYTDIWDD